MISIVCWKQVKRNAVAAFNHSDFPFDMLVEELNHKQDLSRSALFDVMVLIQDNETTAWDTGLDGLEIKPVHLERSTSKFDLMFDFSPTGDTISYNIEYNSDIYSHRQMEALSNHLRHLTDTLFTQPRLAVAAVDYLSPEEKCMLLATFNDTATPYPGGGTVIRLFEEQVLKTLEAVAVAFDGTRLTYKQLNQRANQLSCLLP